MKPCGKKPPSDNSILEKFLEQQKKLLKVRVRIEPKRVCKNEALKLFQKLKENADSVNNEIWEIYDRALSLKENILPKISPYNPKDREFYVRKVDELGKGFSVELLGRNAHEIVLGFASFIVRETYQAKIVNSTYRGLIIREKEENKEIIGDIFYVGNLKHRRLKIRVKSFSQRITILVRTSGWKNGVRLIVTCPVNVKKTCLPKLAKMEKEYKELSDGLYSHFLN